MPDWREGNPYQRLLGDALTRVGVKVAYCDMPAGILALNRMSAEILSNDVIHLHWIGTLIEHVMWSRSAVVRTAKLLMLALDIVLLRLRGKRVVWTIHNLVSHESADEEFELAARRVLAVVCSGLIVHSAGALAKAEGAYRCTFGSKAAVIPHGNYDGIYLTGEWAGPSLRRRLGIHEGDITLLFFGAIRDYKGIEFLLEVFEKVRRSDIRLIIAGHVWNEKQRASILKRASEDLRISTVLERVPDGEVGPLHQASDAVIIPFARTLTSGSVVLALTLGKALILPKAAKILGIVDEGSTHFFGDAAELGRILESLDRDELQEKGKRARARADSLDWASIALRTRAVYEGSSA